jgi:hypothetical protein
MGHPATSADKDQSSDQRSASDTTSMPMKHRATHQVCNDGSMQDCGTPTSIDPPWNRCAGSWAAGSGAPAANSDLNSIKLSGETVSSIRAHRRADYPTPFLPGQKVCRIPTMPTNCDGPDDGVLFWESPTTATASAIAVPEPEAISDLPPACWYASSA